MRSVTGRKGINFVEKEAIIAERDEKEIMINVLGGRTTMTRDDVVSTETMMTIAETEGDIRRPTVAGTGVLLQ